MFDMTECRSREAGEGMISEATFGNVLISQMCKNVLRQIRRGVSSRQAIGEMGGYEVCRKLSATHTPSHTNSRLRMCCFYFFAEFRCREFFFFSLVYFCDVILLQYIYDCAEGL